MSSPLGGRPAKKRRRIRFDLQKAMFVLPNLFTVSSIFCGFYAVTLCLDQPEPIHLYRAAIAIFFAMFFDMFDGRVARLTRTQSEFGVQLDSLADVISFGVAPGVLLYKWMLAELGFIGIVVGFVYAACGALRLARFNVLASREPGSSKYFLGLPIPLAAGAVVSLVMSSYGLEQEFFTPVSVAVIALFLAALMVSNVRYRTFKDLRPSKKSVTISFVLLVIFAGLSTRLKPTIALSAFFLGYISLGLAEGVIFFKARRAQVETAIPDEEAEPTEADEEFADDEDEEEEEEVQERTA